jgi:hypothetical protein
VKAAGVGGGFRFLEGGGDDESDCGGGCGIALEGDH